MRLNLDLSKIEDFYIREIFKQIIEAFREIPSSSSINSQKSGISTSDAVSAILVDSTDSVDTMASILFDSDSILYNDDEAI